jgi:transcriptional regulator with PAS, ATPase and Fis domain
MGVAQLNAEEERLAFAARFQKFFEHLPAAVWVTNTSGELIARNKAAATIGLPFKNETSVRVLKDSKPVLPELSHFVKANGNSIPLIISAAPLYDTNDILTGTVVIAMEIEPKILANE